MRGFQKLLEKDFNLNLQKEELIMKKIKVRTTMTLTVEYEINPEYYAEGSTVEQMIETDIDSFHDDPTLLFSLGEVEVNTVTVKLEN